MLLDGFTRGIEKPVPGKEHELPQTRWFSPDRLAGNEKVHYDPDTPGGQILLGAVGADMIGIDDPRHLMTVAGSRAGKSVTITANLLCYRGSVLAIDPKGELANKTARRRARELGQDVYVLDPFNRTKGVAADMRSTFNPLSLLTPESDTLIEDTDLITDALVVRSGGDQHWDDSARSVLQGLILHTVRDVQYQGARDLLTVRELLTEGSRFEEQTEEDPKVYSGMTGLKREMLANARRLKGAAAEDAGEVIARTVADLWERPKTEMQSVLSTARRHTKFLDFASMQTILSDGGTLDLRTLKTAPRGATIYLCVPASRLGMLNRWLRLFLNLGLNAMEREDMDPDAPPVLFVLDEFPVLGYMKQLEDAAGQIASFGVRIWTILQDLGQLKALYKERADSFLANCGVFQAFGNNDLTTLEYIQRRCGKTAVLGTNYGETTAGEQGQKGESKSWQVQDLITAEEASRLFGRDDPQKRQLIIWASRLPMVMQRVEYYDENGPFWSHFKGKFDD